MVTMQDRLRDVVGGRSASALNDAFEMETVADLMQHYPRRYETRGELTDLNELRPGEPATIIAEVRRSKVIGSARPRGKTRVEVVVTDGRNQLAITFFNQVWRAKTLTPGRRGLFSGKVSEFRGALQMANPQCR